MTILLSWDLADLGIASVGRSLLALASPKEAGLITADWYEAGAALPNKKAATRRGGRKKLATDKRRFYMIGSAVDKKLPLMESAFTLLKKLKITNANCGLNEQRSVY